MTSGIPFSKEEIEFVKAHSPKEFPSVIARGLALKFRDYNGGSRNPRVVAALMNELAQGTERQEKPSPKPYSGNGQTLQASTTPPKQTKKPKPRKKT